MPTIKTIMPGGGGDYTSLQTWWDSWASQQVTADQWAECYTGDMGGFTTLDEAPTATPDASNYFRIYAAEGQTPEADNIDFQNGENYSRVEGISCGSFYSGSCHSILVDRCTFEFVEFQPNSTAPCTIQNCIIDATDQYCALYIDSGSGDMQVWNNVIRLTANLAPETTTATIIVENMFDAGATYTIENNIISGYGGAEPISYLGTMDVVSIDGTFVINNNIADDGSIAFWANTYSGSNNQSSVTMTTVFTDYDNQDYTLAAESPALDAGKTIGSVTTDYLGISRPQGSAYDIGAYEVEVLEPEISVSHGEDTITDGDSDPIDFGTVEFGGSVLSETFTVSNTGTATLNISDVTVPEGFTISEDLPATIDAEDSADLVVVLSSTSIAGEFSGDITILSDDSDEGTFNFAIIATVSEEIIEEEEEEEEEVVERVLHPIYTFEVIAYNLSNIDSNSPDSRENILNSLNNTELWFPSVGMALKHGDRFTRKGETASNLKKLYVDVAEPTLRIIS